MKINDATEIPTTNKLNEITMINITCSVDEGISIKNNKASTFSESLIVKEFVKP